MTPPGAGLLFLVLAMLLELFPVLSRQCDRRLPKLRPGGMRAPGMAGAGSRDVQRAAATVLGPSDIEVRTVAACRVAMARAAGISAAAGGLGQAALDHAVGGAEEFAEQSLPTHIYMLRQISTLVKKKIKKTSFLQGIPSQRCENRLSEHSILRRKVATLLLRFRSEEVAPIGAVENSGVGPVCLRSCLTN